ncbi:MAG TPA: tyrosine-type recombinase/integrase [Gemmataceae bacterium]|nr:tyrosine-type recombinase/integrase [Gemmataceae bacterium]
MARRHHVPTYRLHKQSGQAVVTLTDTETGASRDALLGPHGTAESRQEYTRVLAEWEARGRRLQQTVPSDSTVSELLVRFLKHAETYYRDPETGEPTSEYKEFARTAVALSDTYPHLAEADFGPAQLKVVRDRMIGLNWSRTTVNQRVRRVRHIWKWGVEDGFVPASTWHGLCVVRGLQAGRSAARETTARRPVADEAVDATLPHLPRHVRGLVQFQRLTGCRPAEACRLRLTDVDTTGSVWIYTPPRHKCSWRGHRRQIGIGPQAQRLLNEFLVGLPPDEFVFSPYRQREERYAAMRVVRKSKVQPSQQNRRAKRPMKAPGSCFLPGSVGRAIQIACRKANVPAWHPYQLRHAAGAKARRLGGLDAAQALLGHKALSMTEHYAKLNVEDVVKVAARFG